MGVEPSAELSSDDPIVVCSGTESGIEPPESSIEPPVPLGNELSVEHSSTEPRTELSIADPLVEPSGAELSIEPPRPLSDKPGAEQPSVPSRASSSHRAPS